jgi:proteasome lid subunit RPN8/RPN11
MSYRLLISADYLDRIGRHGAEAYPEECCGVLIGRCQLEGPEGPEGPEGSAGADGSTVVEQLLSVDNERADSRHNRYVITPETVLAAQKQARAAGLDIVGYYHSHPDHPARPSEFDREHAWPGISYLIVSVQQGRAEVARSWRLTDDRERFDEEPITASGGTSHPLLVPDLAPPQAQKEAVP